MAVKTLYQQCLNNFSANTQIKKILLQTNSFRQIPVACLKNLLIYFSPVELEYFDRVCCEREISNNDLWRTHFELIWSLSRDDKETYDSICSIPYKRLYFEYLFHDSQILQLGIYTHIHQINRSKSIPDISFFEQIQYNLTRDSIIYCSKRRFTAEQHDLLIIWNHQWNRYIKRFILIPNVWNLAKIDPLLMECFTENVTDLVLSGYPTENDLQGMKFILDVLTRGHMKNIVLKFPSYCLMNILLPLLMSPRTYSLTYLSSNVEQQELFSSSSRSDLNIFSPDFSLVLDNPSNMSRRRAKRRRQLCFHVQFDQQVVSSTPPQPSVDQQSTLEPHQRLLPYLNRSRTLSGRSISRPSLGETIFEPIVSSDTQLVSPQVNDRSTIFHLPIDARTDQLTHLSIYYVSSIEIIDMIAIALLGMHHIRHVGLVNFALYSSQLERSLIRLCQEDQLESLHLTGVTFIHGAIGFLRDLFQAGTDRHYQLKRLRLDTIKIFSSSNNMIDLVDVEQSQWMSDVPLESLIWRERHMQYIHMRLLYKLIPHVCSQLHRLELNSILECHVLDQYLWCQTFLQQISDVRLRNIRLRSENLSRFFLALNTQCHLTVFHFERVGFSWNTNEQSRDVQRALHEFILNGKYLTELSLAYNNLNHLFIDWLCQLLMFDQDKTRPWWSITRLNLTFNLISSESLRQWMTTLQEYQIRWQLKRVPIRRLDILGNAIDTHELPRLKNEFHVLGCELTSYMS